MLAARVFGEDDRLDEAVKGLAQVPLKETVLLNSVPKCGTHLVRNIVRMFVPPDQHLQREFVQLQNLKAFGPPFAALPAQFLTGHLGFTDETAAAVRGIRHVVLVRDPYDYVIARARFLVSDQFDHPLLNHLKGGSVTVEQLLNLVIMGIPNKGPALADAFRFHATGWMGTGVRLCRYEDVLRAVQSPEAPASLTYLEELLADFGIDVLPGDWVERVRTGADRKWSRTSREKLATSLVIPAELPPTQKRLVDYCAPGLRELLGYA